MWTHSLLSYSKLLSHQRSRAAELVVEALNGSVLINPVQAESIVQATTERTTEAVDARSQGKQIDRQQADDIARAAARYSEAK